MAEDWLDPDYQYEGSQEEWFDWSVPYSSQEPASYETSQPSLNIPWREQPEARVGTEVIQPYYTTSEKSWLDTLGDVIAKVGPSLVNIFGSSPSQSPQPASPPPASPPPTATPGITVITPPATQSPVTQSPATQSPATNVILSIAGDAESALGSNWMIYIAIGLAAYYFLR